MTLFHSMIIGTALFAAPAAFAQTAPQQAPGTAAQSTTTTTTATAPSATPTASAGTASVSDAEVAQFATAALAVEKVRKDASVAEADKNAKMVEAIAASGIAATRFNEIAQAMQADPALNKRIQAAAGAQTSAKTQ